MPKEESQQGTEEQIAVRTFVTTPAMVTIGYPIKMTNDFQTVGFDCSVTIPCYVEEIKAAQDEAAALCIDRLKAELPKLRESLRKIAKYARGE